MKKITFSLDPSSLSKAIKELEAYRVEFDRKCLAFVRALTEQGAEIAKMQIVSLGAIDTGELANSIQTIMYVEDRKGVIFTDCPYAAFCEFGTGVYHNGSGSYPSGLPAGVLGIGEYGKGQGKNQGWVYFDEKENRVRFTRGMHSRPFMLNTVRELAEEAVKVAREVFG